MQVDAILARLGTYNDIMIDRNFIRARSLWTFWSSYNDPANPLRDDELGPDTVARLLNNLADTARNETLLILARLFDLPGRNEGGHRVSFPVIDALIRKPGVRQALGERAAAMKGRGTAEERATTSLEAADQFLAAMSRLRKERPNRIQRFRDFRDQYLAHTLDLPPPRDPPIYRDIQAMLDEVAHLLDLMQQAIYGRAFHWFHIDAETNRLSDRFWKLLVDGHLHGL